MRMSVSWWSGGGGRLVLTPLRRDIRCHNATVTSPVPADSVDAVDPVELERRARKHLIFDRRQ
jgi:hypothetical protein